MEGKGFINKRIPYDKSSDTDSELPVKNKKRTILCHLGIKLNYLDI